MARLTRQTLSLFGVSGPTSDFGQFGSQAASSPVTTKNVATIQALAAWADGWQDAVALGQAPYLQDMNGWMYVHSYEQCYSLQEGIPEYDAGTTYYIGGLVKNLGNSGYIEIYASLTNTNLGNALPTRTNNTNWQFVMAIVVGSNTAIAGTATNDNGIAGTIGEYLSATASGNVGTSGQFSNVTSITLTAGDWDVSGICVVGANGATLSSAIQIALSADSGNSTGDHVNGDNVAIFQFNNSGTGNSITGVIPAWRVSIASTTTIYLKTLSTYSGGPTPQASGRISARRVR
jgi:hypothetical protein